MKRNQTNDHPYVKAIRDSDLSIYDPIVVNDPKLWIPTSILEVLLEQGLKGMSVRELPIRTRSKVVKQAICRILGYPVPKSFKRTRPRFPGQGFDTYIQKSNNLQIWNEEIVPERRYVIIRVSPDDVIERVKVTTGEVLAKLDKTGTLTRKYQARVVPGNTPAELVTPEDTANLRSIIKRGDEPTSFDCKPADDPTEDTLLPVTVLFERLKAGSLPILCC